MGAGARLRPQHGAGRHVGRPRAAALAVALAPAGTLLAGTLLAGTLLAGTLPAQSFAEHFTRGVRQAQAAQAPAEFAAAVADFDAAEQRIAELPEGRRAKARFFVATRRAETDLRAGIARGHARGAQLCAAATATGLAARTGARSDGVYDGSYRVLLLTVLWRAMPDSAFVTQVLDGSEVEFLLRADTETEVLRRDKSLWVPLQFLRHAALRERGDRVAAIDVLQRLDERMRDDGGTGVTAGVSQDWRLELALLLAWHSYEHREFESASMRLQGVRGWQADALRGQIALRRSDYATAEELIRPVVARDPRFRHSLAEALEGQGRLADALQVYAGESDEDDDLIALNNRADLHRRLAVRLRGEAADESQLHCARARALYERALRQVGADGGDQYARTEKPDLLCEFALLDELEGRLDAAAAKFDRALDALDEARRDIPFNPLGASWLDVDFIVPMVDGVLRVGVARGRDGFELLAAMERVKARDLLDWLEPRAEPDDPAVRAARERKMRELNDAVTALALESHPGNLVERRRALERARFTAREAGLRRDARPLGAAELRARAAAAGPGTVILSYWVGDARAWLVVVTGDRAVAHDLGAAPSARRALGAAFAVVADPKAEPWPALDAAAQLFLPGAVRAALAGAERVVFCPDSVLGRLPLAALRVDGVPLGARLPIEWAPSLSVWARLGARDEHGDGVVVVDDVTAPAAVEAELEVSPLRFSAREGAAVADFYRVPERPAPIRLTGASASLEQLRAALARTTAGTVHVSAHAIQANAPSRSLLLLADGPVTMHVLTSLPLRGASVVLSSCSSAHGQTRGGEGVNGLLWGAFGRGRPRGGCVTVAGQPGVDLGADDRVPRRPQLRRGRRGGAAPGTGRDRWAESLRASALLGGLCELRGTAGQSGLADVGGRVVLVGGGRCDCAGHRRVVEAAAPGVTGGPPSGARRAPRSMIGARGRTIVSACAPRIAFRTDRTGRVSTALDVGPGSTRMRSSSIIVAALAVTWTLAATDGKAQTAPAQVVDINATPVAPFGLGSSPRELVTFQGWAYFAAERRGFGTELFRSRGGAAELVADIEPGAASSYPAQLTPAGGLLFFVADRADTGREIWATDGTAAGTALVRDLAAGPTGSRPLGLVGLGGALLFYADDGVAGRELWRSDGTAAGTALVRDIFPGSGGSRSGQVTLPFMTPFGSAVYFGADDGSCGFELWRTDGTAVGTELVHDVQPGVGSSFADRPFEFGGALYFVADDGATGPELWRSDGTTAAMVADIAPGAARGVSRGSWAVVGNQLYFPADDGVGGQELWRTDGTAAGTAQVADIATGGGSSPYDLTPLGANLLFIADDGFRGRAVWVTDGTAAGTTLVADLDPGPAPGLTNIWTTVGGLALITSNHGALGNELWTSDGTAVGTSLLVDLNPGSAGSNPFVFGREPMGSRVLFAADDGVVGDELWATDGTAAGTSLYADVDPMQFTAGSDPRELTDLFGTVLFSADDGVAGRELWRSDGTAAGTWLVSNLGVGAASSDPAELTRVGAEVYFAATDSAVGRELFASDGGSGSRLVADIAPGAAGAAPGGMTVVAGRVYFAAADGVFGRELWVTDGTGVGTRRVHDIAPGAVGSDPSGLVAFGGRVLFCADDGVHGCELWISDGTAAGTAMVRDIWAGPGSSNPTELTVAGEAVLFAAATALHGCELWRTDGTPAGTRQVADIVAGPAGSGPMLLTPVGDAVFFGFRYLGALFRSDGTTAGTQRVDTGAVTDIVPWGDGVVYAIRRYGDHSLMRFDSTGLEGLRYGFGTRPAELTAIGSRRVYFVVGVPGLTPGYYGYYTDSMWVSEGTQSSTRSLLATAGPFVPASFLNRELTLSGGSVLLAGTDGERGFELWSFDPGATAQPIERGAWPWGRSRRCGRRTPCSVASCRSRVRSQRWARPVRCCSGARGRRSGSRAAISISTCPRRWCCRRWRR